MSIDVSLDQPFPLSPGTAAQKNKITGDIEAHNRGAAELESQAAALRAANPADWSLTDDSVATKLRSRKLALLSEEIELRGRLQTFYAAVASQDQPAAVNAAIGALEDARASVRDKLVGIGYGSDGGGGLDPLVARHPDVTSAIQALDAIRSYDSTLREKRNANSAALKQCQDALADVKAKSLAVLG